MGLKTEIMTLKLKKLVQKKIRTNSDRSYDIKKSKLMTNRNNDILNHTYEIKKL